MVDLACPKSHVRHLVNTDAVAPVADLPGLTIGGVPPEAGEVGFWDAVRLDW